MTYRTWRRWLHRYADAYMARILAGSAPTSNEQTIARMEAELALVVAETKLLGAAHLTGGQHA